MCYRRSLGRRSVSSSIVTSGEVGRGAVHRVSKASRATSSWREEQRRSGLAWWRTTWSLCEGFRSPGGANRSSRQVIERHGRVRTNDIIHSALLAWHCRHRLHVSHVLSRRSALNGAMQRPGYQATPRKYSKGSEGEDSADADEDSSIREIRLLHESRAGRVWDLDLRNTNTGKRGCAEQSFDRCGTDLREGGCATGRRI